MKIEIKEHSKDPDVIEVETFDPEETFKFMTDKDENNNRVNDFISFGKNIYSVINIQSIKVLESKEATE